MYISATQIEIKSIFKLYTFFKYTFHAAKQIKTAAGLISQQTRAKNPWVYLTLTAWDNKESMLNYRNHGAHLEAMKILKKVSDKKVKVANWESDKLPDWKTAFEKIAEKA